MRAVTKPDVHPTIHDEKSARDRLYRKIYAGNIALVDLVERAGENFNLAGPEYWKGEEDKSSFQRFVSNQYRDCTNSFIQLLFDSRYGMALFVNYHPKETIERSLVAHAKR